MYRPKQARMGGRMVVWQVAVAASTVVAVAYFAIAYAVFRPLLRTGQLRTNRLGTATGTIFFTCAVGHALHAWHLVLPATGVHAAEVLAARASWQPHDVLWELFTAAIGVYYWSLRRSYGAVLEGASLFEDLQAKEAALRDNQRLLADRTAALTELAESEQRLHAMALYDALTGLANRRLLMERLDHALARARRQRSAVGLIYVDLDRFKAVNDVLGHDAGDELLRAVAMRLTQDLRQSDTAARLGGDEFVILCEDVDDRNQLDRMAERVLSLLAAPMRIAGRDRDVTASIGVAYVPDGQAQPDGLLLDGDRAMYEAKQQGRARYVVFDDALRNSLDEKRQVEDDLRTGIGRGELRLHYQPVVDLGSGAITGVEALVRWQHPTRGLLSPDQFIGIAEDTRLIMPLGRWVLREACTQLGAWQDLGLTLTMAVNVSAHQLSAPDFADEVATVLSDSGVAPQRLCLELTETSLLEACETTADTIATVRTAGVSVALDDFGTGYSSLTYLHQFPVDALKIDRAFVGQLLSDAGARTIVAAILRLAADLGLQAIAEGVETPEQSVALQSLGCAQAQGYLFCRPQPPEQLQPLLTSPTASNAAATVVAAV